MGADSATPPISVIIVAHATRNPRMDATVEITSVVEAILTVHLRAASSIGYPCFTIVSIPHFAADKESANASIGSIPLSCQTDASTPQVENFLKATPHAST